MWRRSSRDRIAIVVLVVATLAVLTLDFRTHVLDGVGDTLGQVVGVFQTGVRTVARPFENIVSSVTDLTRLRAENEQLKRENETLKRQAETYADTARENARMRQMLTLGSSLDVTTVAARVIGASLSGLERSVLIDRGTSAGVTRDTAVLAPEGLVGRVVWAGARTSKVLLLTDAQSAIGVRIGETGENGVVTGTGDPVLRLELISRAALDSGAVRRGDVILTSGQEGGIFPPGVPIGRVEEVASASRGTSYRISVRPFASLTRLDILSVVLRTENAPERPPRPTPSEASR